MTTFIQEFKRGMKYAEDKWVVYMAFAKNAPPHIASGEHTREEMQQAFADVAETYFEDPNYPGEQITARPDVAAVIGAATNVDEPATNGANGQQRIPGFISNTLKRKLRAVGITDEQIFNMLPEEACRILGIDLTRAEDAPPVAPGPPHIDPEPPPHGEELKKELPRPALPKTASAAEWIGRQLQPRRYIAPDFLPFREVSLFNGHGGSGKTQLALQIAVAVVLGTDCFTFPIAVKGPVIFYTVEEEQEEIQHRLQRILERLPGPPDNPGCQLTLADLSDLHIIAMSEKDKQQFDMSLARLNDKQEVVARPAYHALLAEIERIKPVLTMLENATDLFPFSELIRELVNQSMTMVRTIARKANCAVLLLQHVSESSRQTGEHKSGSTAWHNKSRYRLSLSVPVIEEEGTRIKYEDDTKRILAFHKNQYGKRPENITLDNEQGYFGCPRGSIVPATTYERERREEETFMMLLDRDAERGLYWSPQPCATWVVKAFVGYDEGRAIGRTKLKATLERLKKKGAVIAKRHPLKTPSKANLVLMRDRTYGRSIADCED
jgi:RecA-family ATPase